jgi:D-amino-acid dehydrogenase
VSTVAVIGAGIVGASAARRLSAAGVQVTLIDDRAEGGATAAGAGIIATIGSRPTDPATAAFRFAAARHYPELVELCDAAGLVNHSYASVGQLTVAFDGAEAGELPAHLERARELVNQFGPDGVGTPELLTGADIADRFPLLAPMAGGLWLPDVARVDGRAMRDALIQLALANGARLVNATARVEYRGGVVAGVRVGPELLEVDAVVVAAGSWSGGLLDVLGPRVQPQRGQIVHLQLPGASALPTLATSAGHYLLSFPGDRVVIGATRETGSGFDATLTAGGIAQVIAQGVTLVPALADATWIEARVGLRPASHDGFPYLGPVPGVDGLWLATGMGPSGLTFGPYCGSVIADHALARLGGDPAPAIPATFDPGR